VRVLGVIDWASVDKSGQPIAGVLPLYEVTISGWRAIEAGKEFPTSGLAFWFRAEGAKGELLFFRPEENPGREDYEFKVGDHHVAIEVRDFRKLGSPEIVRLALTEGLKWPDSVTGRALLWCAGDVVVGPVKLIPSGNGLLTFDHSQKHEIPCYAKGEIDIRALPFKASPRFVLAEDCALVPTSYVDWESDRLVAGRAMKWAANRSKAQGNGIELTRNQIKESTVYLTESGGSAKLKLEQYRLQRTLEMFTEIQRADQVAASAVEALQGHPSIALELERLREEVKKLTAAEVRETLRTEQDEIVSATLERERIQVEIATAQVQLESLREELESTIKEVDSELNRRISEILKKPAALLAEVAILRTMSRGPITTNKQGDSYETPQPFPQVRWPTTSHTISEFKEFRKALVKTSAAAGVPATVPLRIHAALTSRVLAVVGGPRAVNALDAYASVACGGRIFRVHASPNFLEPSDLFGKFDIGSRHFLPHAAGLIDVLRTAQATTELALIVIEGVNRAPIESYFMPLLELVADSGPLHLFHQSAVRPDDSYRDMHEIRWPSNLLLAATVVEGPTTLPMSVEVWGRGVFIETDGDVPFLSTAPDVSQIAPDLGLVGLPEMRTGIPNTLLEILPEYGSFRDVAESFLSTLSIFEPDDNKVERAFLESILLPLAISYISDDEREEALARLVKAAKTENADAKDLQLLARRIRRRIG